MKGMTVHLAVIGSHAITPLPSFHVNHKLDHELRYVPGVPDSVKGSHNGGVGIRAVRTNQDTRKQDVGSVEGKFAVHATPQF